MGSVIKRTPYSFLKININVVEKAGMHPSQAGGML
jgi:hypothetical protein